jgi:hypothetical protein
MRHTGDTTTMIQKLAVAGAIIVAAAAPAAAATITPGYYQSQIYISAIKDPKNACADIGLVQGVSQPGVADVRGAGKPMYLTEMFTVQPPTASSAQEVVFVDYVFHDFPQTITDPVTYDGPARGTSPVTQGVSLRWTGGTLNTLTPNQFKLTASQITVTRDKTRLCTASIDAVFEATGLRKATGL